MKIAFWSEQEGAGTTFNLAAVACAAVLLYPVSIAVISGDYQDEDLEKRFAGEISPVSGWQECNLAAEQTDYYIARGMDFLLHKSHSMELDREMLKANMKHVAAERLYCLTGGKQQYSQWWNKEMLFQQMGQVFDALEQHFNLIMVDCGCRKDDFTRRNLEEADVCVLNMHQEAEQIGEFYRVRPRLKGKVFFLVGSYFKESVYNRSNLQKLYRLEEKQLGAVPYNMQLQTAGQYGRTQKCIKRQLQPYQGMEFQQELMRSTRLIMELAGVS